MSKYIIFFNISLLSRFNLRYTVMLIALIWGTTHINAQRFGANMTIGANAAQINGDDHAGYNKVGATGGIRTDYYFKPNMTLGVELLYSQRGSRASIASGVASESQKITLNYIEIPVIFSIHDWYIEDPGFYKVKADLGLSYGNMINISSSNSFFDNVIDEFGTNDVSFLLGATFKFTQNIGFTARYTRSLTNLYNSEFLVRPLLGYFLTFRFEYYLL